MYNVGARIVHAKKRIINKNQAKRRFIGVFAILLTFLLIFSLVCFYNQEIGLIAQAEEKKDMPIYITYEENSYKLVANKEVNFDKTFTFKPHYYHDQGVLPYDNFLNDVSIIVGGVVSFKVPFMRNIKEYAPNKPIRVDY